MTDNPQKISVEDLVAVVNTRGCQRCADADMGLIFTVKQMTFEPLGIECRLCGMKDLRPQTMVRHPARAFDPDSGGWLPIDFLKKINPPRIEDKIREVDELTTN